VTLSKREKVLAGVVGVLLVGTAAYATLGAVVRPLLVRNPALTGLEQELQKKKLALEAALKAKEKMADLRKRSLPREVTVARSEYQTWLLKLAETHLRSFKVVVNMVGATTPSKEPPPYNRFSFTVTGQASLAKVIQFLYEFYSVGYLHQIDKLALGPVQKTGDLQVNIEVQALSLLDSPVKELATMKPERPLPVNLASYIAEIAERDPFSPPKRKEVVGPTIPKPKPPEPPKFDPSKYAVITGIVREDDVPLVFVNCRTTGEKLRLRSGEKFKVGELAGTIGRIGDREVEILLAGKSEPILRSVGDSLTKNEVRHDQPEPKPVGAGPASAAAKGVPPAPTDKNAGATANASRPTFNKELFDKYRDAKSRGKGGKRGRGFGSGGFGPKGSGPEGPSPDGGDRNRK
jgi:hypothetical protein